MNPSQAFLTMIKASSTILTNDIEPECFISLDESEMVEVINTAIAHLNNGELPPCGELLLILASHFSFSNPNCIELFSQSPFLIGYTPLIVKILIDDMFISVRPQCLELLVNLSATSPEALYQMKNPDSLVDGLITHVNRGLDGCGELSAIVISNLFDDPKWKYIIDQGRPNLGLIFCISNGSQNFWKSFPIISYIRAHNYLSKEMKNAYQKYSLESLESASDMNVIYSIMFSLYFYLKNGGTISIENMDEHFFNIFNYGIPRNGNSFLCKIAVYISSAILSGDDEESADYFSQKFEIDNYLPLLTNDDTELISQVVYLINNYICINPSFYTKVIDTLLLMAQDGNAIISIAALTALSTIFILYHEVAEKYLNESLILQFIDLIEDSDPSIGCRTIRFFNEMLSFISSNVTFKCINGSFLQCLVNNDLISSLENVIESDKRTLSSSAEELLNYIHTEMNS